MVAAVVVASASAGTLPSPLFRTANQATALASAGARIAAAATCDVWVVDESARPKRIKRFGFCREDRFDSAVLGLWLGRRTIVEEIIISPSPHGEGYQLWSGPVGGRLHEIGGEWGWTNSDEPPTFGCDRMVAAGAGALAITPVVNNAGDGASCATHTTTPVLLRGSLNRRLDVPGSWGALATNGKRIALAGFDSEGRRTSELAMISVDGRRLSAPHFSAREIRTAYRGWFTPIGLFLDTQRGLVGPGSRLLASGYDDVAIAEGRAVYVRGRFLRARRLTGGPDRLVLKLRRAGAYVAAGSLGIAVLTGTESSRSALYRIPWRTIDAVLPR